MPLGQQDGGVFLQVVVLVVEDAGSGVRHGRPPAVVILGALGQQLVVFAYQTDGGLGLILIERLAHEASR